MKPSAGSVRVMLWIFVVVALAIVGRNLWRKHRDSQMIAAVRHGDAHIVRELLASGVSPHLKWENSTLLEIAFSPLDPNDPIPCRYSPEVARLLVDAGTDINAQEGTRSPPLLSATGKQDVPLVRAMLAHGADPNLGSKGRSETALYFACMHGNLALVNALLEAGADPNLAAGSFAQHGFASPLQVAALYRSLPVVQRLVEAGAEVNHVDGTGFSALFQAVSNRDVELTRYLLAHGANPNLSLPQGRNLMREAVLLRDSGKKPTIYNLLIAHGGKPTPAPPAPPNSSAPPPDGVQ